MILYLDTSALIKAYIEEKYSEVVLQAIAKTKIVASSMISYVELHAALARLQREKKLTENEISKVKRLFKKDWENYLQVEIVENLLSMAAEFTEVFALCAYDSVQLAAAQFLLKHTSQSVLFACFDNKLNQAAHVLGLELLDLNEKI